MHTKQCVEEDYAGLNFSRKESPSTGATEQIYFPHHRASWYKRRLKLKSSNWNRFIFEDAREHLVLNNQPFASIATSAWEPQTQCSRTEQMRRLCICTLMKNASMFAGWNVSGNANWNAHIYKNVHRYPAMCKCLHKSKLEKKRVTMRVCVCVCVCV